MSGFNTSARTRDDVSLKLRSQNMRHTREQTKKLEDESRKMEDRLRELKMAMTREKEEREKQGGGFWGKGQTSVGSLTGYANEVLHSKAEKVPKEGKKKKLKVLHDEPIELPKRSSQPGTVKYIAQRKLTSGSTPRDKQKGPKCGQCEERSATLSCVQCSEIYCAGCFAAFHLKGALKQHRSCPISATGSRVCMSPRPSMDASPRGSQASGSVAMTPKNHSVDGSEASGPYSVHGTPRQSVGESLLQGDYDESQSAASFQQALMAWRQGEEEVSPPTSNRRPKPVASPVKSPVVSMDCATGTTEEAKAVDIKFTGSLSYVEKLMLKKHRRTELDEQSTPRLTGQSGSNSQLSDRSDFSSKYSCRQDKVSERVPALRPSFDRKSYSDFNEDDAREKSFIDDGERVDFQSLYEAVMSTEGSNINTPRSDFTIVDITNSPQSAGVLNTKPSLLSTEEVTPLQSWALEGKSKRESSAKFSVKEPGNEPELDDLLPDKVTSTQPSKKYDIEDMFSSNQQLDKENNNEKINPSPVFEHEKTTRKKSAKEKRKSSLDGGKTDPFENSSVLGNGSESHMESSPMKHSKSRAVSGRPKSSMSRPASRAQSRAASRMKMADGLLTKTPSKALHDIASLGDNPGMSSFTYQSPLEGFFLAGVDMTGLSQNTNNEERTITPSANKTQRPKSRLQSARGEKESVKVSNRLYQMAPRSWRPDSSLGDTIPLDDVRLGEGLEPDMVLSYSYSGQMSGRATDWRPSSSQSSIAQNPSDDLDLHSSHVYGDGSTFKSIDFGQGDSTPQPYHSELPPSTTPTLPHSNANSSRTKSASRRFLSDSRSVTPVIQDSKQKSSKDVLQSSRSSWTSQGDNSKDLSDSNMDPSHNGSIGFASGRTRSSRLKGDLLPSKSEITRPKSKTHATHNPDLSSRSHTQISDAMSNGISSSRRSSRQANQNPPSGVGVNQRQSSSNQLQQSRPNSSTNMADVTKLRSSNDGISQRPNSTGMKERSNSSLNATSQSFDKGGVQDSIITDMMSTRVNADGWMQRNEEEEEAVNNHHNESKKVSKHPKKKSDLSHWETEVRPFTRDSLDSARLRGRQMEQKNERGMSSRPSSTVSRPESRAIEMDGEDLSMYDSVVDHDEQNKDDSQALEQLEWELASNTGRLTADGNISRMSMSEHDESFHSSSSRSSSSSKSVKFTANDDYDLTSKLLEDERLAEQDFNELNFERSMNFDEDEVKALR